MKQHQLGELHSTHLLCYILDCCKSQMKVLARSIPLCISGNFYLVVFSLLMVYFGFVTFLMLQVLHLSFCLPLHVLHSPYLCLCKNTRHPGVGPIPVTSLKLVHLQRPYFHISSLQGIRDQDVCIFWGDTILPVWCKDSQVVQLLVKKPEDELDEQKLAHYP